MQSWNDISFNTNIAIDDFHNLKDEEGFFHFYNSLILEKKTILVTVDINSNFGIKLKDLNSRFKSFTSRSWFGDSSTFFISWLCWVLYCLFNKSGFN